MGWWRCENGIIGDVPADILDNAIEAIENVYMGELGRQPTQGELANLIEFCTCGIFLPNCANANNPFSKTTCADKSQPRLSPIGNQGVMGPASLREMAENPELIANIDPKTEENYNKIDIKKVKDQQIAEAKKYGMQTYFLEEEDG